MVVVIPARIQQIATVEDVSNSKFIRNKEKTATISIELLRDSFGFLVNCKKLTKRIAARVTIIKRPK